MHTISMGNTDYIYDGLLAYLQEASDVGNLGSTIKKSITG